MIKEFKYSEKLKEKAEEFIIKCFDDTRVASEVQPIVIEAAMNIINGNNFVQPALERPINKEDIYE